MTIQEPTTLTNLASTSPILQVRRYQRRKTGESEWSDLNWRMTRSRYSQSIFKIVSTITESLIMNFSMMQRMCKPRTIRSFNRNWNRGSDHTSRRWIIRSGHNPLSTTWRLSLLSSAQFPHRKRRLTTGSLTLIYTIASTLAPSVARQTTRFESNRTCSRLTRISRTSSMRTAHFHLCVRAMQTSRPWPPLVTHKLFVWSARWLRECSSVPMTSNGLMRVLTKTEPQMIRLQISRKV